MILKKKCADFDFVYQFSKLTTEYHYQLLTTTEKLKNFKIKITHPSKLDSLI